MATPKSVLIDIDIRAEDIKAAQDAMMNAKKEMVLYTAELARIKKEQAELNKLQKDGAITTEDYAEMQVMLTGAQKEASKGLQESNKAYVNNKIVVDAAKGSNDQLRAQLSLMTKEYNALSKEQRENSARGAELQGQIKGISDKLKENEKAIGDNRRNVGNYEGALRNVIGVLSQGGGKLKGFGDGLLGVTDGFKAAGGGVKGFGMALMSLGLPLIIAGVTALVNVFKQFKPVADAMEEGVLAVKAAFGALISGNNIMEAVKQSREMLAVMRDLEDTQKAFNIQAENQRNEISRLIVASKDRTKTDKERLALLEQANRIEEKLHTDNVARVKMLLAEESKAFRTKVGFTEQELKILAEGTTQQALKLRERAEKVAAYSEAELESIQDKLQEVAKLEGESMTLRERLANRSNQLQDEMTKDATEAATKQAEAARKAAEERAKIQEKERADAQAHAQKMAEIAETFRRERMDTPERMRLETEERAALLRKAGVAEVEIAKWKSEELEKIDATVKAEQRARDAAAFNNYIELIDQREQLEIAAAEESIKNEEELATAKNNIAIKYLQKRLEIMREQAMLDDVLTQNEINNLALVEAAIRRLQGTMADPDAPNFAEAVGMSETDFQAMQLGMQVATETLNTLQQFLAADAESRLSDIDERSTAEIQAIKNSTLSEEEKTRKIAALERKAAMDRYKIELEQFNAGKAISIVQAVISTAQAVISAFNAGAALGGPAGVVAGPLMAAAAGALGAVQIGMISAQQPPSPPKLAKGGVLVGPSHAEGGIPVTVDGRSGYEAEGGEIVLTKGVYSDPHLRQMASEINVAGGGVPIVSHSGRFAMGGALGGSQAFAARSAASGQGMTTDQITVAMSQALMNQPTPVVRVSDINRVAGDAQAVRVSAEMR